ncbi:MAG: adenylate/guanylate cyclase domain-containing protein [Pseudomonadota bacterium]
MSETRRVLSAILAADVVNYSGLMGGDEAATLGTLNTYRAVFRSHVSGHGGRVVDTSGDSVLAVFESVVEAVEAGIAVQKEIAEQNKALSAERQMRFRIGINLGDVIEQEDGTIYGDGVNIAARLQSLAEPGSVTLSESAFGFIEGRVDSSFEFAGEFEVKNIIKPVRVYKLNMDTPTDPAASSVESLPERPSIAVLPFSSVSADSEDEYFADGIAEDIITELSRFKDLVVTARNTSFQYKGRSVDTREVSHDLNVRYLVEGSVRKGGARVRVTATLVEAETGSHIWAERYDRTLDDVFAVQDELTGKIVATLFDKVSDNERRRALSRSDGCENLRAYDLVLKGRQLWSKFTKTDNEAARACYLKAVELDPDYGRSYASLAWSYIMSYDEYWSDSPQNDLDEALKYALKGAEIDSSSHTPFLALGWVYYLRKDLPRSLDAFERAMDLNPNDPDCHTFQAMALAVSGHGEQALELLDQAFSLNSNLTPWHRGTYIGVYMILERFQEAVDVFERIDNARIPYYRWAAASYAHLGDLDKAKECAQHYLARYPDFDLEVHLERMPFTHHADGELYAAGLKKAGFGGGLKAVASGS